MKNFEKYKENFPIAEITLSKLKQLQKHISVKCPIRIGNKKMTIRVRIKPSLKMTVQQELLSLRRMVNYYKEKIPVAS